MTRKIVLLIVTFCFFTGTIAFSQQTPNRAGVPGVVIDYSPAKTRIYIGSPSIAVLPNGQYVASHDFFGPGSKNNRTAIFRSADAGKTWRQVTDLEGQWWSNLFMHNKALYIMGTNGRHGAVVIRRSTDGGKTWTVPKDSDSGRLTTDGRYHTAPVPVVVHKGRIWRAMEQSGGGYGYLSSFVMSVPVDADLLKADNWIMSNRLSDPTHGFYAWREGNIVITPEDKLVNIMRVHIAPGKAAVIQISDDGKTLSFNRQTMFIDFPGGGKKFTIRYDSASKQYWSLVNYVQEHDKGDNTVKTTERIRNTLALTSSPDLKIWTVKSIVLYHPDVRKVGFQYVDWLFEGDDLIAVCRTAFDDAVGGAHNSHDANYFTFHRIKDFRKRTLDDPPLNRTSQ